MTAPRIRFLVRSAAGLALVIALAGCGDDDGTRLPPPAAPPTTLPATTAAGGSGAAAGGSVTSGGPTTAPVPTSAGSSSTRPTGGLTTIEVRLVGGQPEGGVRRSSVGRGQQVRIVITADRADEAHLHGYERTVALEPERPAALELSASVPGVFELETHQDRRTILELEVR